MLLISFFCFYFSVSYCSEIFLETEYMCCLQQFLYPSEEDLYKLVRFLVEKLPESSEGAKSAEGNDIGPGNEIKEDDLLGTSKHWAEKDDNQGVDQHFLNVGAKSKENSEVQESLDDEAKNEFRTRAKKASSTHQKMDSFAVVDVSIPVTQALSKEKLSLENGRDSVEQSEDSGKDASGNKEMSTQRDNINILTSFQEQLLKVSFI